MFKKVSCTYRNFGKSFVNKAVLKGFLACAVMYLHGKSAILLQPAIDAQSHRIGYQVLCLIRTEKTSEMLQPYPAATKHS